MRAPRELLSRRTHLRRKRAELLAHVPNPHAQYNVPEIGKPIAYTAHRAGVAERFDAPAVPKPMAVDLDLIPSEDQMRSALARFRRKTAKQHDAPPLDGLQPGPGIGPILSLVGRYAMHQLERCPRVPEFASYGRLGKGAPESGGKRLGTSGNTSGHAHRTWAVAEAPTLFLRGHESLDQRSWPGESKSRTQAKRGVSLLPNSPVRSMACSNEKQPFIGSHACAPKGAERVSPAPHSTRKG